MSSGFVLPPELRAAAEYALERRFEEEIRRAEGSHDPADYKRVVEISDEAIFGDVSTIVGAALERCHARSSAHTGIARTAFENALTQLV